MLDNHELLDRRTSPGCDQPQATSREKTVQLAREDKNHDWPPQAASR